MAREVTKYQSEDGRTYDSFTAAEQADKVYRKKCAEEGIESAISNVYKCS